MKYGFIYLLISCVVTLLMFMLRKSRTDDKNNILRYPKYFSYIYVIGISIMFFAIIVAFAVHQYKSVMLPFLIFVLMLIILCFCMLIKSINWRIELYDEYFVHQNFLGKRFTYKYDEVNKIKIFRFKNSQMIEKYKLFVGSKVIVVNYLVINYNSFQEKINKKCKKILKNQK